MALLYERAGRLTAKNGGFRPGQNREHALGLPRPHEGREELHGGGDGEQVQGRRQRLHATSPSARHGLRGYPGLDQGASGTAHAMVRMSHRVVEYTTGTSDGVLEF